jgi:hypothetical protein
MLEGHQHVAAGVGREIEQSCRLLNRGGEASHLDELTPDAVDNRAPRHGRPHRDGTQGHVEPIGTMRRFHAST